MRQGSRPQGSKGTRSSQSPRAEVLVLADEDEPAVPTPRIHGPAPAEVHAAAAAADVRTVEATAALHGRADEANPRVFGELLLRIPHADHGLRLSPAGLATLDLLRQLQDLVVERIVVEPDLPKFDLLDSGLGFGVVGRRNVTHVGVAILLDRLPLGVVVVDLQFVRADDEVGDLAAQGRVGLDPTGILVGPANIFDLLYQGDEGFHRLADSALQFALLTSHCSPPNEWPISYPDGMPEPETCQHWRD